MREDWIFVKQRYEAWWEGEMLDRPLVRVTASAAEYAPPTPPHDPDLLFTWLTDPELVLPRLEARIAATGYRGDAFPWADPLSQGLAAIQAAYHGAPYHVDPGTLTGWAAPLFDDWSHRPRFFPVVKNPWWLATLRLLEAGSRQGRERWCVAIPDLQGGGEILALLHGSERLALDLVDRAEEIAPALAEINAAWLYYYTECFTTIHHWQEGFVDWLGIWSDVPAATVECDYMVMVSPKMFERFFLPAVAEQVGMVERSIFHLDGPGAVKHLDMLLALPDLRGIQWVPTPERPRPGDWIGLFQRIQAAGKRLILNCTAGDLMGLFDGLKPELLLIDLNCSSLNEADEIMCAVERRFGIRSRKFSNQKHK